MPSNTIIPKVRESRGDTIVEVLIALAVLTTILVGAYVTATRSANTNRASQERSEATKVAESQIERLKGLLAGSPVVVPIPGNFCINEASNTIENISTPSDPFAQNASVPFSGSCGNINTRYNIAIKTENPNTYRFKVQWDRIGGGRDQINMYYRAYK